MGRFREILFSMILGAVLPECTENGFDTLNRYVGKVVYIYGKISFRGNWQNLMKKGYVLARCEKMSISEGYWHFQCKGLIFPTFCRHVRKFSFWTFLKKQGNF